MSDEPVKEAAFFSTIRSWRITRGDNRVFGGVLSGVAARVGMAAVPARIIFVVLAIVTGGIALLAYAAAWALLPDSRGSIIVQDFGRGRPSVGSLIAIVVLTIFGFIFLGDVGIPGKVLWLRDGGISGVGDMGGMGHVFVLAVAVLIPLAILAGIIALIVWAARSSSSGPRGTASGYARLPDGSIPTGPASAPVPDAAVTEGPKLTAGAAAPSAATTTAATATPSSVAVAPAPPTYAAPPTPPVYSAPPRPRVPGPGKMGYLLALAWIPLSIAITTYLWANDRLAVFPLIAAAVLWVAGLGVILVITALRGRKLGFLGFVSVVALIPLAVLIGAADEFRENYAQSKSQNWANWWEASPSIVVDEVIPVHEPTPFDPAKAFWDYSTVAIDGSCWEASPEEYENVYADGIVRLTEIPADQSITVSSGSTRLIIPKGTNLEIVAASTSDYEPSVTTTWPDRDVACSLNPGSTSGVTLTDGDGPTLTVRLNDANQMGSMSLWIEEN